jgi:hypothetical protein
MECIIAEFEPASSFPITGIFSGVFLSPTSSRAKAALSSLQMLKLLVIVLFALILEGNLGLQVASMVATGLSSF